jgi:hypothetical protein
LLTVGGAGDVQAAEFLEICKQAGAAKLLADPLENFCAAEPEAPECLVYDS